MGNLSRFLKNNKAVRENYKYAASKAFTDENGVPVEWEFRPISTKEHTRITEECTYDVPVKGRANVFMPKVNQSKLIAKLIVAATVYPNLNDKELQDSYGVMGAEELLEEMLDDPVEYYELYKYIDRQNHFDEKMQDKVDEVKN